MKLIGKGASVSALLFVLMILFSGTALAQGPESEPAQAPVKQAAWMEALAETLDMPVDTLQDDLQAGKTVADLAAEQGLTMGDIANALYNNAVERLNDAVSKKELTQEAADRIEIRLAERRDACVNDGNCALPRTQRRISKKQATRLLLQSLRLTAKSLDMTIFGLLGEFEAGNSLAEVALQQGTSLEAIADTLYNAGAESVERALSDGKLTQNQADKILARLENRRDACANKGQCLALPKPADKK